MNSAFIFLFRVLNYCYLLGVTSNGATGIKRTLTVTGTFVSATKFLATVELWEMISV